MEVVAADGRDAGLDVVDALARLHLAAARSGYCLRITGSSRLRDLIELAGLSEVLFLEVRG